MSDRPTPFTVPAKVYFKKQDDCPDMVVAAADFDALVVAKTTLERQLASSKSARLSLSDACDHLHGQLDEAREQRDRLAAVLIPLMGRDWFLEGQTGTVTCSLDADQVRSALACLRTSTVEGGGK